MLLEVSDLRVAFRDDDGGGVFRAAVDGLSFSLAAGKTLGLVGESGSGKSVSALALLGLLPRRDARVSGKALLDGVDLLALSERELRARRGRDVAMIFQDPMTALNPYLRIERQLSEVLETHEDLSRKAARPRVVEMLERVGLPDAARRARAYPHELSGGMRQRVMIAMSLLCRPRLLIADEPTTALDVTVQAQILALLGALCSELGTAIILITHDMGVVAGSADEVLVLYAGRKMEQAPTTALFDDPRHPYTRALLRSIPRLDGERPERLEAIEGLPPRLGEVGSGCPFAARCGQCQQRCREAQPPDQSDAQDRVNHCFFPDA
ncbi:MAG: ABC transporter ATP-binding protein [Myxococcales bacterium]|nr:ABC transporter ATP-binding protein [Myxococcales bacterium]